MSFYFQLSGTTWGLYTFPQNPERMSIITPKSKHSVLTLLDGENIYQRALLDNEVRTMSWSITSYANYTGLKNYAERNSSGLIPVSYFWDGTVNEYQGTQIEVIDVYGRPIEGKFNQWSVELQFKPIGNVDKLYKVA